MLHGRMWKSLVKTRRWAARDNLRRSLPPSFSWLQKKAVISPVLPLLQRADVSLYKLKKRIQSLRFKFNGLDNVEKIPRLGEYENNGL